MSATAVVVIFVAVIVVAALLVGLMMAQRRRRLRRRFGPEYDRHGLVSPDEPVAAAGQPEPAAGADQIPEQAYAAQAADADIPGQRMARS